MQVDKLVSGVLTAYRAMYREMALNPFNSCHVYAISQGDEVRFGVFEQRNAPAGTPVVKNVQLMSGYTLAQKFGKYLLSAKKPVTPA